MISFYCSLRPSETLNSRTLYNYVTYRNTISFLKSQRILVPGLKPEHLLPYAEYVYFKNNLVDTERTSDSEILSEYLFYRFSKQKWLDLFLRIYKVLVSQRILDPEHAEPLENADISEDREAFEKYFQRQLKLKRFPKWFKCDAKILLWLEYHYNRQRKILWPDEEFGSIKYFDSFSNIDDSVALATVTAAFCPYLTEQLRDVYACPKKLEHKVHNACKIVQVWRSLKLSFDIHPQGIVAGNEIKILLIVTFLYGVLPHFYPSNEVRIEAPLSESVTHLLNVSNCANEAIKYAAIFFGKGSELFQIDSQQIMIAGKQTKKLRLTYFAQRVFNANCILILSGEASGQKYAKSIAISLTGTSIISECEEIKIQVETYVVTKKRIALQTPYGKSYTAKISICFEEPKSYKDIHAVSSIKARHIPREVNVVQDSAEFVNKGEATITLDMCFLSQGHKFFYLFFCNDLVGDFCVLMNITSFTKKQNAIELLVKVPDSFRATCSCKLGFSMHCPKTLRVDIPCRNPGLWKSTTTLVERCFANSVSIRVLKKYFGTPLVFRVTKFYLERSPEGFMLPYIIFDDQAEYTVTSSNRITAQRATIRIRDVTLEETVPLIIHWNEDTLPEEEYIELRNINEKEIRYFKLVFLKPISSSSAIYNGKDNTSTNSSKPRIGTNVSGDGDIESKGSTIISSRSK